jgi:hypothetical protein
MKYYVREIKPYIQLPIPGTDVGFAVDGYGWVPEDMEEELRSKIELLEPWDILIFKERFVEVQNEPIL